MKIKKDFNKVLANWIMSTNHESPLVLTRQIYFRLYNNVNCSRVSNVNEYYYVNNKQNNFAKIDCLPTINLNLILFNQLTGVIFCFNFFTSSSLPGKTQGERKGKKESRRKMSETRKVWRAKTVCWRKMQLGLILVTHIGDVNVSRSSVAHCLWQRFICVTQSNVRVGESRATRAPIFGLVFWSADRAQFYVTSKVFAGVAHPRLTTWFFGTWTTPETCSDNCAGFCLIIARISVDLRTWC